MLGSSFESGIESGGAVGAVVLFNKSVFIENSEFVRLSGSGLFDTAGFMTSDLSSKIKYSDCF